MRKNADGLIWALRHLFRYGSVLALRNIVQELNSATSQSDEVLAFVKAFSDSLADGIKSIESGIM